MHLLPCPACEYEIPVAPSQAGDQVTCTGCGQAVPIPKLGELRKLPRVPEEESPASHPASGRGEISSARSGGFLVFGLIAVASLLVAGFCGIRWGLIQPAGTTEQYLESVREKYASIPAAQLIREFEDMEKLSLELTRPYDYKLEENERNAWGTRAIIAAGVAFVASVAAGLTMVGRAPTARA